MKAMFVESSEFTKWVKGHLDDDAYRSVQNELMANPASGDVMGGCGGLRKMRVADPARGKGKRGGARVIYLHIPVADRFFLLDVYGKNEMDDLSPADKKQLKKLALELKKENGDG